MKIHTLLQEKKNFTPHEIIIADYLLSHPKNLNQESTRQIAKKLYISPSTIVRLCQKLDYAGYDEFKQEFLKEYEYQLKNPNTIDPNYPFDHQDPQMTITYKIGQLYHDITDDVLSLCHHDRLQKAIQMLLKANHIYLFSAGVQNDIACTFKDKMLKIGFNVVIETQCDQAYYRASYCDQNDVFIIISYSGETQITTKITKKLAQRHIPIIAITSYGQNILSHLASCVLYVSTRETLHQNIGNFSMNLSTLLLLDILYANIFNQHYQTHLEERNKIAKEFETVRFSNNPLIKEDS